MLDSAYLENLYTRLSVRASYLSNIDHVTATSRLSTGH